jgi:hypothetical protein
VLEPLDASDYAHIGRAVLGETRASAIDFAKVHRFARRLTARQLRRTFESFAPDARSTPTASSTSCDRNSSRATSNRRGPEGGLADLKGIDDVIAALEAHIIIPLEQCERRGRAGSQAEARVCCSRARRAPERRQSAVRWRDGCGEVLSDRRDVHPRLAALLCSRGHVFEAAKQNAPGVIFIDDSDVIFETAANPGCIATADDARWAGERERGRVCVMMTAMDVGNLPPALVRSGRIELWLETRYPDLAARRAILSTACRRCPTRWAVWTSTRWPRRRRSLGCGPQAGRGGREGALRIRSGRGIAPRPAIQYFTEAANNCAGQRRTLRARRGAGSRRRPNRPADLRHPGAMVAHAIAMSAIGAMGSGADRVAATVGAHPDACSA